ncbi:MAG: hypothetical protein MZW92_48760 [Comamonadaceae bacterium]|nr:hypothetical protein [Comamonadaceae bacterium]
MPELEAIAPKEFAARIKRKGVVNAWDDEDFANACRATGKRNFVMAGVTTDVCMVVARDQRGRGRLQRAGGVRRLRLEQPDRRRDGLAAHGARGRAAERAPTRWSPSW